MNNEKIVEFLDSLTKKCGAKGFKCEMNFKKSKSILKSMKIIPALQEKFLEKCQKYGGFCDCEILFNAEDKLKKVKIIK